MRGDVYLADLNPSRGSEQAGIRPVIIVQRDRLAQFTTTSIVVPYYLLILKVALDYTLELDNYDEVNIVLINSVAVARRSDRFLYCAKKMFVKSNLLLTLATRSRGYTDKTRLRGLKTLIFSLVYGGGLPYGTLRVACFPVGVRLCSSEFYSSPKSFVKI